MKLKALVADYVASKEQNTAPNYSDQQPSVHLFSTLFTQTNIHKPPFKNLAKGKTVAGFRDFRTLAVCFIHVIPIKLGILSSFTFVFWRLDIGQDRTFYPHNKTQP